ncbi:protein kinase domain-containing protein [Streptomyces sp. NPDC003996]
MAASRGGRSATGTGGVRKFPTGANYAEALQHPELCFRDPDLKRGTVQQTPVLGPKAISGNFASVFSITAKNGQRYALKCFTRDTSAIGTRYAAISAALRALDAGALSQPWAVRFEFLEQGVLAVGDWYPVVKMAWVEGTDLITWIERHLQDTAAVQALADRFLTAVGDLDDHGIAHGDLQHGNILVAADGTLRLVDYDGMYVPALKGEVATENGHRNYQSPTRTAADFGPAMDRFSAWLIHFSLVAVAADPGLWTQLHDRQGEYLILSESDFKDPGTSLAWPLLLGHPEKRVRALAARIQGFLTQPCSALPHLTADAVNLPAQRSAASQSRKVRKAAAVTATSTTPQPSPGGVIPAWMAGHIPSAGSTTPSPPPSAGFSRRRPGDLAVAATALLGSATPGVLAVSAVQPQGYLPVAQGAALITSAAIIGLGRRLRPEYRVARQRTRSLRRRARELKNPASARKRLEQEIRKLDDATAKENATADHRIQALQTDLRDGLARITVELNRSTAQVQQQIAGLPAKEQSLIAQALEPTVRTHIDAKLRRTPIHDARDLQNMGAKTIEALVDAGIRTAADFTGVAFSLNQSYGTRIAYLVRPSGQRVRVPHIGEARATALNDWRTVLEQRARASAPTVLPPQQLTQIRTEIATQRTRWKAEIKQAEGKAQQDRDALQKRTSDERQRLTAERQQRSVESQRKRAELLQHQKQLTGAEAERVRVTGELATTRAVTRRTLGIGRYVKFMVTGR